MKTKITLLQFLFLSLVIAFNAQGQSQKIIAMNVEAIASASDSTRFGVPRIDSLTVYTVTMHVNLDNTDDIYQIHVKVGNTLHGTERLTTSFDYGVNGSFGTTTYTQTGNQVDLGLGTFTGLKKYFAEVQIERNDHSYENAVLFSR